MKEGKVQKLHLQSSDWNYLRCVLTIHLPSELVHLEVGFINRLDDLLSQRQHRNAFSSSLIPLTDIFMMPSSLSFVPTCPSCSNMDTMVSSRQAAYRRRDSQLPSPVLVGRSQSVSLRLQQSISPVSWWQLECCIIPGSQSPLEKFSKREKFDKDFLVSCGQSHEFFQNKLGRILRVLAGTDLSCLWPDLAKSAEILESLGAWNKVRVIRIFYLRSVEHFSVYRVISFLDGESSNESFELNSCSTE